MQSRNLTAALIILLFASLAFAVSTEYKTRKSINVPVKPEQVVSIVKKSNESARIFIERNFWNESDTLEKIYLDYDKNKKRFIYVLELTQRACGCAFNTTEEALNSLDYLRAEIDPITGKVYKIEMRKGVSQEKLARESCERGCHETK